MKKAIGALVLCYLLWGLQPLYMNICGEIDSMYLLAQRVLWCCLFTMATLAVQGRFGKVTALLRDKRQLRLMVLASVFVLVDWGVYTVAVRSGHVLDSALGYYLNPLVTFVFGLLFFREKCPWTHFLALGVALLGVMVSAVTYRSFSWVTISLALAWAVYAALQKLSREDAMVSIAVQTLILAPLALAFLLWSHRQGTPAPSAGEWAFLAGSGVVTALPMLLFAYGVNAIPLSAVGFFQYLSPSFALVIGVAMGEEVTAARLVTLLFILLGIAIFSVSSLLRGRGKGPAGE